MIRNIIKIDEEKCSGCAACANTCHQGAIKMINGKATLVKEDYCDGLGNCLPVCPTGAISFEEREVAEFKQPKEQNNPTPFQCPGTLSQTFPIKSNAHPDGKQSTPFQCPSSLSQSIPHENNEPVHPQATEYAPISQLRQWPIQVKLAPITAPYFQDANLLIAADCCAYSYGNFHNKFMKNKVTLIACPKLDATDYSEKLREILQNNDIKSVTVTRMQVPCCGGLEQAIKTALQTCGKMIPWQIVTITSDGRILE